MKTLILLTQKYPFESGEEFITTELKFLEQAFDRIIILPTGVRDYSKPRQTGEKVKVRIVKNPETDMEIAKVFFSNIFQTILLLFKELKRSGWKWKLLKYYFYHIPYALQLKSKILEEVDSDGDIVLYSYWMDTNAFAATLLKKDVPKVKLVVRSHGGDLYNERHSSGSVPFRQSVYGGAESLLFISDHGLKYASNLYPGFASKMKISKLGVEADETMQGADFPKVFHIVSCSSLIALKRVKLIAEVLNTCKIPINWTHFGGEPSEIASLTENLPKLRDDLEIDWKGKVVNKDIHRYYSTEFIDTLINLSSSEGIPVSMMEAISFGIPLFANAVGGIPEIAGEETGILLPEGLSVKIIASHLENFLLSGKTRNSQFREGVKRFYLENYNAKTNYEHLIDHLKEHSFNVHEAI